MADIFSAPHFHDDTEARKVLETLLWPDGTVCPHCGVVGHAYATKSPACTAAPKRSAGRISRSR